MQQLRPTQIQGIKMNNITKYGKIGIGFFVASILFVILAIIFVASIKMRYHIANISSVGMSKFIVGLLYIQPLISWLISIILMQIGGIFKSVSKSTKTLLITGLVLVGIIALFFVIAFMMASQRW